jgi:hypothetical protein
MHFAGMKIFTSLGMVEPGEPFEVVRTWKERLLTRPWRPLKKTKTVTPMVPMKQVLMKGTDVWMHPETLELMTKELLNQNSMLSRVSQQCKRHDDNYFKWNGAFGMDSHFGAGE